MTREELEAQNAALRGERDAYANAIAHAKAALDRPVDLTRVLDTHAGRALWQAVVAGQARAILTDASAAQHAARDAETAAVALRAFADNLHPDAPWSTTGMITQLHARATEYLESVARNK